MEKVSYTNRKNKVKPDKQIDKQKDGHADK